ncbi:hypothetical protein DFP72DRAFT_813768 [Ephemerocybe angulata]|uniref:Uncharacterized protein n=1 Tax=Ephemerocybe angulata TaxID=980116 RepID=A0A8H6M5I7_9AGAR|nr:hypothetical protein DFP72DRAFT_813768 [Tulosesus angulatus]
MIAKQFNATRATANPGTQLLMCCYGLSVYLETPREKRTGRLPAILVSFLIFFFYSVTTALDTVYMHDTFQRAIDGPQSILSAHADVGVNWTRFLSPMCVVMFMALGDAVLLYRCTILWSEKRWVCTPLYLLQLACVALGIRSVIPGDVHSEDSNRLESARTFISVSVNVLATTYLATRLYQQDRQRRLLFQDHKDDTYRKIARMLIESAVPPAVFGVVYAAFTMIPLDLTSQRVHATLALKLTFSFLFFSCTLAPQVIIFRVNTGRTYLRRDEGPTGVSTDLVFAHSRPIEHSVLVEGSWGQEGGRTSSIEKDYEVDSDQKAVGMETTRTL